MSIWSARESHWTVWRCWSMFKREAFKVREFSSPLRALKHWCRSSLTGLSPSVLTSLRFHHHHPCWMNCKAWLTSIDHYLPPPTQSFSPSSRLIHLLVSHPFHWFACYIANMVKEVKVIPVARRSYPPNEQRKITKLSRECTRITQ